MKKNKLVSFLIICLISVFFVGCKKEEELVIEEVEVEEEENMFGLTEKEQKMYAEYAAGALMKYNAGSNMRILEGQKLINEIAKEEAQREQAEKREQAAAEYAANGGEEETESSDSGSETIVNHISDLTEAVEASAFSIQYTGCEITDSYPDSGEDAMLSVDASDGKVLLVAKFSAVNLSQQAEELDVFSMQPEFKLELNGTNYRAEYTLLLEDLAMYKGEVEAGSSAETVLIFEIPEEEASNVGDMELAVTTGDTISYMQLSGTSILWTNTTQEMDESANVVGTEEEEASEEFVNVDAEEIGDEEMVEDSDEEVN